MPLTLDEAVRRIGCFDSFADLVADMKRTGYVPTIRANDCSCHGYVRTPGCEWQDAARLVRMHLTHLGLTVYPEYGQQKGRRRPTP